MNRLTPSVLGAVALIALPPVALAEVTPFGLWARGDGKAKVRIERCGSDLCAVNVWIKDGTKDEKAGDKLVMSVTASSPARWTGTAFDPQRDLSYRISIEVGENRMTTRGCILAGLLCKDMGWRRIAGE